MALTVAGIIAGLAGAAAVAGYLEKMLFGLAPLDPLTFISVPVAVVLLAAASCCVPAGYATRIHPLDALRHE